MSNNSTGVANQPPQNEALSLRALMQTADVQARLQEILGKRAATFATSVVQLVNQAPALKKCEPKSILNCAMVSATLDLSINPQLGQAWVVPYGNQATFQLGVKGLKQLAMRSGQFLRLNAVEVYQNQFKSFNPLTEEIDADFNIEGSGEVVGYCAYMKLINGFEKTIYWPIDKVRKHGQRYSKTFKSGPWTTEFDKMALKTVMKTLLNGGEAPLSIEMQKAIQADQGIITDVSKDGLVADYPDNLQDEIQEAVEVPTSEEELDTRIRGLISSATTLKELESRVDSFSDELKEKYAAEINAKREEIVKE